MLVLRVFLSSPGDVGDERALVRHLLKEELPYKPLLRGRVLFDVASWDDPVAPMPMPALLTPQEAVNRFGSRPSECDIVVVVLWSRLGTHLDVGRFRKPDGEPYLSGTEWEYEDAAGATSRPEILVYRRLEKPRLEIDDPGLEEKREQWAKVSAFFERFRNPDGSFQGGVMTYETPTEFKERLANDLEHLLRERLGKDEAHAAAAEATSVWVGSPYPGLRPFRSEEAAIFFGRGREVDALVARLRDPVQRFIAVVGASGTGKSSLVRAGLIPRLTAGAIEGYRHWRVLSFTPATAGGNPFLALSIELDRMLPPYTGRSTEIAKALAEAPSRLAGYTAKLLAGQAADALLLLFVDQLEELFAPAAEGYRSAFAKLLAGAAGDPRLRVLATLREDFLSRCAAEPDLAAPLQTGTVVLGPPGPAALVDMIRRPAERAGLDLENGLADEILKDGGGDPGALPLVAFCLEELYQQGAAGRRLTLGAYRALGGLRGAISRRVAVLLVELSEEFHEFNARTLDAALSRVFAGILSVGAAGKAARRWALRHELPQEPPVQQLVEKLIKQRLLIAEKVGRWAAVTLAHEALIQEWPELREWLSDHYSYLQNVQRLLLSLTSPDPDDRVRAIRNLGTIRPPAAEAVSALASLLNDPVQKVRATVFSTLEHIGPAAVPALVSALDDPAPEVRGRIVSALGRAGPAAVPALVSALDDPAPEVRRRVAHVLESIGSAAAEAAPGLIHALDDSVPEVRAGAASALGNIASAAAKAVPALVSALIDAVPQVRTAAAAALGRIGPAAAEAVPALVSALGDPAPELRARAASAFGSIGPAATGAVLPLVSALGDQAPQVRASAAAALGSIGPAALPALTSALSDPAPQVREGAVSALGQIGPAAAKAVPALVSALGDPAPQVRAGAVAALGRIGPAAAEAVPALTAALEDQYISAGAANALERIRSAFTVATALTFPVGGQPYPR